MSERTRRTTYVNGQKARRKGTFGFMPSRFRRTRLQSPAAPDLSRVIVAGDEEEEKADKKPPGLQAWQDLVLRYADKVPIVSAAERYYIEATKQISYFLTDRTTGDSYGQSHPAQVVVDIMNKYYEEVARGVGLRFLIGETRFTFDPRTEEIEAYGAGELYNKGGQYRVRSHDGKERDLDPLLGVWRSHDPDRKYSELPTSSLKPLIDVMESIVIAYAEERAHSIRQTMNAGMVVIHESVFSVGGDEDATNSEGSGPGAALEARFQTMLGMTIQTPRVAAGFAPAVLVVGGEDQDVSKRVAHVSLAADRDKRKISERLEMLKKEIAVGIDLPSDQAQGFLADMNHWNGRLVDANSYKNYVGPKVKSTAGDMFEEIAEMMGIDITGVYIGLDSSELVIPDDMADTGLKAHAQGIISDKSAREASGFSEEDAPTDEHPNSSQGTTPEPAPDETSGDETGDQEADDSSEGITAAAAMDGPNLERFNEAINNHRYAFEKDLREAVMAMAPLVKDNNDTAQYASELRRIIHKMHGNMAKAASTHLATRNAKAWYDNNEARLASQADRAASEGIRLIQQYLSASGGTEVAGRDSYGLARSIESIASGGQGTISITAAANPNGAKPTPITDDYSFTTMIAEEANAAPEYTWEHGVPSKSFGPHEDLDGVTWTAEDEETVLDNPNDYPSTPTLYPGDHDGCTCRISMSFEEIS